MDKVGEGPPSDGYLDNVEGNERSDEEAKAAARGLSSEEERLPRAMRGQLPTSKSVARQWFNGELKKRWREHLEKSPRWPKLKRIDPTAPSNRFRKITASLPRRHVAILTQLRTGHAPLQRHLPDNRRKINLEKVKDTEQEDTVDAHLHERFGVVSSPLLEPPALRESL